MEQKLLVYELATSNKALLLESLAALALRKAWRYISLNSASIVTSFNFKLSMAEHLKPLKTPSDIFVSNSVA
jgi:hypothetical protein